MEIIRCGAVLAALAFGVSGVAHAAHSGDVPPVAAPTTGAKAGSAAGSALHKSVTLDILKAAANWLGVPNKVDKASPTIPFLTLLNAGGGEIAYIALSGCEKGECEGYSIFSIVKAGALTPATIAAYNSKYSYTRLAPRQGGLNFEQQVLVAGGVTDDNIHGNLYVFFKNMGNLTGLLKQPVSQSNGAASATAGFADSEKPGALAGFAETLAPGVFMTGAELETAARANLVGGPAQ